MEKRSGSAAGSGKRWKFSQILGFLDPFVTPRETTSNMEGVEAQIGEDDHLEDQGHQEQTGEIVTGVFPIKTHYKAYMLSCLQMKKFNLSEYCYQCVVLTFNIVLTEPYQREGGQRTPPPFFSCLPSPWSLSPCC